MCPRPERGSCGGSRHRPAAPGDQGHDHRPDPRGGIGAIERGGRGRHPGQASRLVQQSGHLGRQASPVQVRVADHERGAGRLHHGRVQRLVAAGDRQGHEHRRQPAGPGTRPAPLRPRGSRRGRRRRGRRPCRRRADRRASWYRLRSSSFRRERAAVASSRFRVPAIWSRSARASSIGAASATAALSRRAPWLPPNTRITGRTGDRPSRVRASDRTARRIAVRTG